MTSIVTLFSCAAIDVTLERIPDLVDQGELGGLTLEYKFQRTPKIAESVAAMANTYGGIILVGITDGADAERLVGVSIHAIMHGCGQIIARWRTPKLLAHRCPPSVTGSK
jgi:predicted HTH transcriptional regulator